MDWNNYTTMIRISHLFHGKYACFNFGLAALLTEPGKKPWGMESQWDDGVVG
jgi:hypothetical protein